MKQYRSPLAALWGEIRLWLLRKLAGGHMVILNAPIVGPASHGHMWSGQWIVVVGCCIAPDWDADHPVYKQWEAENPKAGHLVRGVTDATPYDFRFKVQGGEPVSEEGITLQ